MPKFCLHAMPFLSPANKMSCLNSENKFIISAGSEGRFRNLAVKLSPLQMESTANKMHVKAPSDRHPIMSENLCSFQLPGRL